MIISILISSVDTGEVNHKNHLLQLEGFCLFVTAVWMLFGFCCFFFLSLLKFFCLWCFSLFGDFCLFLNIKLSATGSTTGTPTDVKFPHCNIYTLILTTNTLQQFNFHFPVHVFRKRPIQHLELHFLFQSDHLVKDPISPQSGCLEFPCFFL